jgi:hypothetical protein
LVLRPAGSNTAFQHHVTRSLRRFHFGSPGSSPCWLDHCVLTTCNSITATVLITMVLDHCVSTPCNSITAAVPRWISRLFALSSITAFQRHVTRSLRRFHVGSLGSSPCWLDHCVSTPFDSIAAAVPRWISRFFALLARSLRLNTMCFDH